MPSVNTVTIQGNVTGAAEKRGSSDRAPWVFSVAYNENRKDKASDEWTTKAHFFDVYTWDDRAERLGKGDEVFVTGRLEQDRWEDKESGAKRSKIQIRSEAVVILETSADRQERIRVRESASERDRAARAEARFGDDPGW